MVLNPGTDRLFALFDLSERDESAATSIENVKKLIFMQVNALILNERNGGRLQVNRDDLVTSRASRF